LFGKRVRVIYRVPPLRKKRGGYSKPTTLKPQQVLVSQRSDIVHRRRELSLGGFNKKAIIKIYLYYNYI
jgi:hypothetical protein